MLIAVSIAGGLIALLLILAMTQPDTFELRRSASIKAPPERVFGYLHDFRQWGAWSPWEKIDADLKRGYGGASYGPGAIYEWEGKKSGKGRMEILNASPREGVKIKLDFIKPFKAHNITDFKLMAQGEETQIDWIMTGKNPFMSKLMGVFINFDKMVGKDFEKGLASLKVAAER